MSTSPQLSLALEDFVRGVRHAARSLSNAPSFTLTAVATLAVAIGANSAVFAALDAVLVRPLPFPDADRIMRVRQTEEGQNVNVANVAPVRLEDWNERNSTFEALTGYYTEDVADPSGDLPERLRRAVVAPRFFDVWGIAPVLGRGFGPEDHRPGAAPVVVISDRYWRRRFEADPEVIDSTVRIGSRSYTLVGIMPPGVALGDADVDAWAALAYEPFTLSRRSAWFTSFGRLRRDASVAQARADLGVMQAELAERFPDTDTGLIPTVEPYKRTVVGDVGGSLWLLLGAVTVLLVIACMNIAALVLARATRRGREDAVRAALGAPASTIAARTLVETALIALLGAALGLPLAAGATAALRALAPDFPRAGEIGIDLRVFLYTLITVVVVTLLCGLVPALRGARSSDTQRGITRGGRGQVSGHHGLQWTFVGAQAALSIMLLSGAAVLARSFQELGQVDPGFDAEGVLTFRITGSYGDAAMLQDIETMRAELSALPGVDSVATSSPVPGVLSDRSGFQIGSQEFTLEGAPAVGATAMTAEFRIVSPGYFDTLHVPLLAGETCRRGDLVVNRAFTDRYLAGRSPVGLRLRAGGNTARIAALVGNARELGIEHAPVPMAYACLTAVAYPPLAFLVRTRGEPLAMLGAVRARLAEIAPQHSVYDAVPLVERIGNEHSADRLRTAVLGLFASAAVGLVCLGVYGTLSYVVSLRRREVGLRVALGARAKNVAAQFIMRALRVVAVSCLAGLALAFLFTRALSTMLYGVSPWDPLALSLSLGVVITAALGAALLPVWRATRIAPLEALQQD